MRVVYAYRGEGGFLAGEDMVIDLAALTKMFWGKGE